MRLDNETRRARRRERDELAPPHSITLSARNRNDSGTFRLSVFAVFKLIANSYFVGSCIGSSPGFAPRRTRSMYAAPRAPAPSDQFHMRPSRHFRGNNGTDTCWEIKLASQHNNKVASKSGDRTGCHNNSAIWFLRECRKGWLDFTGVACDSRYYCDPCRAGSGLNHTQEADVCSRLRMMQECYSSHFGRDLFENFQPFPTQIRFEIVEPRNVSARMAKLGTKPLPIKSETSVKTIGTVRVSCNRAATAGFVVAKITSGASATSSRAATRMRSVTPPVKRYSTRTLRPSIQPRS